jgi:excisionase family DNA binding protein
MSIENTQNTPVMAVSPQKAVELVGVGRTTLYSAIKKGVLKTSKVGSRRIITIEALKEWLASHEDSFR